MENAIKEYLEEACKTDKALAEKYDEKKLPECLDFIIGEAKKFLKGNSGAVKDETVYQWARHFFNESEPIAKETKVENTKEEKPAKKRLGELEQLDLFAGI